MSRAPMFQRATVTRVIKETADARTFVLAPEDGPIAYRAGQYCTFRVEVDGETLYRSYSMSSSPDTDDELCTTVKRVPGGKVSNWLLDNVADGDTLEMTRAFGTFCLKDGHKPVIGYSGGSGITPVLSLAKSALATTDRDVYILCADRDPDAAIFTAAVDDLIARYPGRLTVRRSFDVENGFVTRAAVTAFLGDLSDADHYICGPEPFMDVVEEAVTGRGTLFVERFGGAAQLPEGVETDAAPAADVPEKVSGTITITLKRKKVTVSREPGETILEAARRGGLTPPFSCEAGNCATCIAHLEEGTATMRVNDALEDDEIEDGYTLTCQAVPDCATTVVTYED
ncbi:MAG: ferredoxin--NADP reductase [Gordonia amarae]